MLQNTQLEYKMLKIYYAIQVLGEIMDLTTLGDYTLINKLGEGSFGEVYLAEHTFLKKRTENI